MLIYLQVFFSGFVKSRPLYYQAVISTRHLIAVADVRLDDIPDEVADTDFVCVQEYFKPDAWVTIQQAG